MGRTPGISWPVSTAIGVSEVEHRADVGILLEVVAAEVALEVAIQLGQHVAAIELNITKSAWRRSTPWTCRYGWDSGSRPGSRRNRWVGGAVGESGVAGAAVIVDAISDSRGDRGDVSGKCPMRREGLPTTYSLRHAGQGLSDVDSGHVLNDPAKIAVNEPAGEGQVVSEFMLVARGDLILELRTRPACDRLSPGGRPWNAILPPVCSCWATNWVDCPGRDRCTTRRLCWSAEDKARTEMSSGNFLEEAAPGGIDLGLVIVERIENHADAGRPVVSEERNASGSQSGCCCSKRTTRLEREPAERPGILDVAGLITRIGGRQDASSCRASILSTMGEVGSLGFSCCPDELPRRRLSGPPPRLMPGHWATGNVAPVYPYESLYTSSSNW